MIKLTQPDGKDVYLQVASITEIVPSVGMEEHVKAVVVMINGNRHGVTQTVEQIAQLVGATSKGC
jgi:hypothetical protein